MTIQAQLDALDKAIASGERMVRYDHKQIEYRSIDELIKARQLLAAQLQTPDSANPGILSNRMTAAAYSRD